MPRMPPPSPTGLTAAQDALPPRPKRVYPTKGNINTRSGRAPFLESPKNGNASAISPGRRATFSSRHLLILYMDIAGERVVDMATKLAMHPNSVSAIKGSPLYVQQKAALLEQLAGYKFSNIIDFIKADALKNIEIVAEIRDKVEHHCDPKTGAPDPKIRLRAAQMMQKETDRVYPRISSKHEEERTVRITLDATKLQRIANALHEIGGRVSAETVIDLDPSNDTPHALIVPKSIEELRNELLAEDGRPRLSDGPERPQREPHEPD